MSQSSHLVIFWWERKRRNGGTLNSCQLLGGEQKLFVSIDGNLGNVRRRIVLRRTGRMESLSTDRQEFWFQFYLTTSFVIVEVHQITNVLRLLLDGLLGSVDELPGKLDPVADVVTENNKTKKITRVFKCFSLKTGRQTRWPPQSKGEINNKDIK